MSSPPVVRPSWVELPLGDHVLAECPRWDDVRQRLSWVDVLGGTLGTARRLDGGWVEVGHRDCGDRPTAAEPLEDGSLAVAVDGTVCVVGREGDLTRRVSVSPDFPAVRTNDMTVDGAGRMLVGLFTEDRVSARGGVVAVDLVQGSVVPVATGYVTANGLAVTPDGDVLYAVDTARGSLRRHRLGEAADGGAEVVQYAGPGVLDGLALGPDGDLWVAVWDAGELHRYEASGRLRMTVAAPVARPSAVAIASLEGADHLVVTTARSQRATDVPLAPSPEGRLYATPLPD